MKNLSKYALIFMGICLLIAIGIAVYFYQQNKINEQKAVQNSGKHPIIETAAKIIEKSTDSLGKAHYSAEVPKPLTQEQYKTSKLPTWADTALRSLDIGEDYKSKTQALTRINLLLKDSLLKALVRLDEANRRVYYYQNRFVNLSFRPGVDSTDNGVFSYKYNANFTAINRIERSWFLGRKKSIIDISSDDPNFTINNLDHFSVEQSEPFLGFRLQAIGTYNFQTKNFSPGIGGQFDLGKTSLIGSYYYNFGNNQRIFTLAARHDLIRF